MTFTEISYWKGHVFIVILCQKCSLIRGQEAKETGNQYLGL